MFSFFLPRKSRQVISEAELIYDNLKRNRVLSQDILSSRQLQTVRDLEARYKPLRQARDIDGLEKWTQEVLKSATKIFPPSPWDGWRENVEALVVAAILALTAQSYFLKPFIIPTGSMEPTLYGIEPIKTEQAPPNFLYQAFDFAIHGRSYHRVVTLQGGRIASMTSGTFTIWLEYTDVTLVDDQGHRETDRFWIRRDDVIRKLGLMPPSSYPTSVDFSQQRLYKPAMCWPILSCRPATRCWSTG